MRISAGKMPKKGIKKLQIRDFDRPTDRNPIRFKSMENPVYKKITVIPNRNEF